MRLSFIIIPFLFSMTARAADVDLESMTLENLLEIKTTVTSKRSVSTRAAAGIVTVLTEDDIRNSGARDLMDLLSMVPSISFAIDVQGVMGIATRGFWAHEGKSLLIVDGIEMNELQYGTNQFGNEFPIDQIAKVEIIRGPGSVIYGGFAELAVINITTKSAERLDGFEGSLTHGQMTKHDDAAKTFPGRTNVSLQGGRPSSDSNVSFGFYTGKAARGSGLYSGSDFGSPPVAGTVAMEDWDRLMPFYGNVGYDRGNLKVRYIHNDYRITTRTMFGFHQFERGLPVDFKSNNVAVSYAWDVNSDLKVTPQLTFIEQSPWAQEDADAQQVFQFYHLRSRRLKTSVTGDWRASDSMSFLFGAEDQRDEHDAISWLDSSNATVTFANGTDQFRMNSQAVYAQGSYSRGNNELTFGVRHERPSLSKSSTLPRLAFTHSEKYWHGKLLYSQAFRSPVVFNFESDPNIKPEHTSTAEAELGYLVHKNAYLTGNYFYTRINNPIVYFNNGAEDLYANFPRVANQGLEFVYKYKPQWGQVGLGYSYYQVDTNKVQKYVAEGSDKALLGIPQHQFTADLVKDYGDWGRVSAQIKYLCEKYAKTYDFTVADMVERKLPSEFLVDLIYRREDFLIKNMGALFAIHNVLNQKVLYPEPYAATHSPMPGPSREYRIGLDYKVQF